MSTRRIKLADLQVEIQSRRKALLDQGVALPSDEQLRNKGGRRTQEKQMLLQRMNEAAQAAGVVPAKRYI
jgi:hypothetical protein